MTVRFLADEDIDVAIIRGVRSREPVIDILDVKTAGLRGMKDAAYSNSLPSRAELRSRTTGKR